MRRLSLTLPLPARAGRGNNSSAPPLSASGERGGRRLVGFLLAPLLLAGCDTVSLPGWPKPPPERAAAASAWTRPGADAATVDGAFADCLAMSNTATQKDFDIDQDITASRGSDMQHSAFAGAALRDAQNSNRDRAQAILSSCMEAKGFSPAR